MVPRKASSRGGICGGVICVFPRGMLGMDRLVGSDPDDVDAVDAHSMCLFSAPGLAGSVATWT